MTLLFPGGCPRVCGLQPAFIVLCIDAALSSSALSAGVGCRIVLSDVKEGNCMSACRGKWSSAPQASAGQREQHWLTGAVLVSLKVTWWWVGNSSVSLGGPATAVLWPPVGRPACGLRLGLTPLGTA